LKRPQLIDARDFVDVGDRAAAEIGARQTTVIRGIRGATQPRAITAMQAACQGRGRAQGCG
jgi:hypothetical protein